MITQHSTTTSPNPDSQRTFRATTGALFSEPRLWGIFFLGTASGFPWLIHASCLSLFLQEFGISKATIGYFGLVGISYAINFLFGPLVDHLKIPWLSRLGQRRSWILLCLVVMMVCVVAMSFTMELIGVLDLATYLFYYPFGVSDETISLVDQLQVFHLLALFTAILAFASATLDLSTAAYRITIIREDEPHLVGLAASMEASGWWAGFSLPGILAIGGTVWFGWIWHNVFLGLALGFFVFMLVLLTLIREPQRPEFPSSNYTGWSKVLHEVFVQRLFGPITEFVQRNGLYLAIFLIIFLFSFKLGESFLGKMSFPFYKEIGFENDHIAFYSKFISPIVIVFSSIFCGIFIGRFKTIPVLVVGGIAMSATNLMFSWIAAIGPSTTLYFWTAVLDGFTAGFSTVAFVALITEFTSRLHAATQYATMASLGTLGRTVVAAFSGVLIENVLGNNWVLFFILTAAWIVPALFFLYMLTMFIARRERIGGGVSVRTILE